MSQTNNTPFSSENSAHAAEEKALLLDAIGEGVLGLDHQGNVTFTNTSALRMLRCTEADFLHESVMQFLISNDSAPDKALKDRIMEFSNVVFLSKPYDTEELPGMINAMMMRRVS